MAVIAQRCPHIRVCVVDISQQQVRERESWCALVGTTFFREECVCGVCVVCCVGGLGSRAACTRATQQFQSRGSVCLRALRC